MFANHPQIAHRWAHETQGADMKAEWKLGTAARKPANGGARAKAIANLAKRRKSGATAGARRAGADEHDYR